LAIRKLGLEPRVRMLPDNDAPHILARVTGLPGGDATRDELQLLRAINRRHTHRGPFLDVAPDPELLEDLKLAARLEGARLVVTPDGPAAEQLVELAWAADTEQRTDISWRGETRSWVTPPGSTRRDGVPADAFPTTRPAYDARQLPGRDFDLGRHWGSGEHASPGASVLAMIVTDGDGPRDWLRAGEALQHVLLRAADDWVFAAFATQLLEVQEIRAAVRTATRTPGFPQMFFRLGHASSLALTPRRPVSDVLTVDH
jgi:hypothetical protein